MESLGRILKVPRGAAGPKAGLQYSPEELHGASITMIVRGFPRDFHSYWTSSRAPAPARRAGQRWFLGCIIQNYYRVMQMNARNQILAESTVHFH